MGQVKPSVKLIRYTQNPEATVALAAKLCYSGSDLESLYEKVESNDNKKFIEMLYNLGHLSTFEHASFTFGIEGVSRSLLAQITRHRMASFNVKSQRYVSAKGVNDTFNYIIPPEIEKLGKEEVKNYENQMQMMQNWYNEWQEKLGNNGEKSNEDARFVLPNAAETKMVVTMNARELIHFFNLRCCNRAQWEIREVAWEMLRLANEVAPSLFKYSGPSCIKGICPEGKKTCGEIQEVRERRKNL